VYKQIDGHQELPGLLWRAEDVPLVSLQRLGVSRLGIRHVMIVTTFDGTLRLDTVEQL
jgi:hypothetical protein